MNHRPFLLALCLLGGSTGAWADARSHQAEAERFLQLAQADKLTVPVYAQVQQMFAQRFEEAKAPESKKATLERYQAKANTALDKAVGWNQIKPDMVKLYTTNFSEAELQQLITFYQSPLGKKVMQQLPALNAQSAQIAQARLEKAVPEVNGLMEQMSKELGVPAQKQP
ncbi:DUF2059 domain-containing protein [Pseudomonas matsuisoli]|uniref:DUF2059 domain-containing protein n=1 Tax=Pseudomonas matsuisoli TaxID=1515666 RepID=A0A917UVM2_9PSED|nr:DUF2059 domain-containing protein [Pseudomonas matsuisoli]GGJ89710.1 hypothetical protein GCM10009304_14100 [Pseudomonas matsuisoli]